MSKRLVLLVLFLLFLAFSAGAETEPPLGGIIRKIEITGNRVRESVIRKELTFTEGDRISEEAIEKSKENLYKLGLFKTLEIEQVWDETLDGVKVTVNANDGWHVLPWPILGSRGGNVFGALMVTEKNLLKWGEGITLWGMYDQETWSAIGSVYLPNIYMIGGIMQTDRTEYLYADGAYNTKDFDSQWVKEKPEDFGAIADKYRKKIKLSFVGVGIPPLRDWKMYAGFTSSQADYGERLLSSERDTGQLNSVVGSVGYGRAVRTLGGYDSGGGGFGRIFGMGMAGVEESLKPLPKPETTWGVLMTVERGDELVGSDVNFTKVTGLLRHTTLFRNRSYFEAAVNGGIGYDLPESRRFVTNRLNGLKGVYAREYRGESIAVATAEYSYPLLRNQVGGLIGKGFLDLAICRQDNQQFERQGVGLEVAYKFWRFPLPLGMGITYSFDDRNWQYSLAMGGMF